MGFLRMVIGMIQLTVRLKLSKDGRYWPIGTKIHGMSLQWMSRMSLSPPLGEQGIYQRILTWQSKE